MSESCLVRVLSRYVQLTENERCLLNRVDMQTMTLQAGQTVVSQGSPLPWIYVLEEGWAIVRSRPVRGRSSIVRIHINGEIVGLSELAFQTAPHDIQMQTSGRICSMRREDLGPLIQELPRLGALLASLASIEQISLRDQCAALGLMTAEDRLIHFFLDLQSRLEDVPEDRSSARVLVPFSQAEIGEAVGMTPVYVNKLLRKLSAEGRVEVDRPYIILHNFRTMQAQTGFTNRYGSVDQSWFPKAA